MYTRTRAWRWYREHVLIPYRVRKAEKGVAALVAWAESLLGGECTVKKIKTNDSLKPRKLRRISNGRQSAIIHWTGHPSIAKAFFHIGRHLHARGLPVPQFLHADTRRHFFMLEDLGASLNTLKPQVITKEVVTAAAGELARFHNEAEKDFNFSWCDQPPLTPDEVHNCCIFHFPFWARKGPLRLGASRIRAVEKDFRAFCAAIAIEKSFHRLCHSDFHLGNLFHKNGKISIIDWDFATSGPVAFDLAKFLVFPSAERDIRRYRPDVVKAYLSVSTMPDEARPLFEEQLALFEACCLVRFLRVYIHADVDSIPQRGVVSRNIRDVFSDALFVRYPALTDMMLEVADRMTPRNNSGA